MNLQEIANDVVNTLNHNGFDRVTLDGINEGETAIKSPRCTDCDFTIRVGYWEHIPIELRETMEEYHSVRITERNWDDDDCGEQFCYHVEVVEDGYTLSELMELDSYAEEAEFLHRYESGDVWGIA